MKSMRFWRCAARARRCRGVENHCFFFDLLSRSRIGRKMMHFVPSRDGLNVPSFDAYYFFFPPLLSSIPWFSQFFQGAAAAAAGMGSPPPPQGAGRASVVGLLRGLAPSFGHGEVERARGGGGGWKLCLPQPLASSCFLPSLSPNKASRTRIHQPPDARRAPGGGGLPLPAAAAAAP